METLIKSINDKNAVSQAAKLILEGEVVAFSTETVYGLGANAFDDNAVLKIFSAKGRPQDNPLIVHIDDIEKINDICDNVSEKAKLLCKAFMPGAITVVLKKKCCISDKVSCGLDTIGVRIPNHSGARNFIKACGLPIAAPSANTSKRPSPTTAKHVYDDMNGKIPLILDGGECGVGIESTVIDMTCEPPIILRPGLITKTQIEKVIGDVLEKTAIEGGIVRSPGMKYVHYAPKCEMVVAETDFLRKFENLKHDYEKQGKKVVAMCLKNSYDKLIFEPNKVLLGENSVEASKSFYKLLRENENKFDLIVCEAKNDDDVGNSLFNRMRKACGGKII